MTTPYRESGRTVEKRWAERASAPRRGLLARAWLAFREWVSLWVDIVCALTVWRWDRAVKDAHWTPLLCRENDLPTIPCPLDGLAATVYDLDFEDVSVIDLLRSGCFLEISPDPEAERRAQFYYVWMQSHTLYLAKRVSYSLEMPLMFQDEFKPSDVEKEIVEQQMRRRMSACEEYMVYPYRSLRLNYPMQVTS